MMERRPFSRLLTTTKIRVLLIWNWAALRFEDIKQWSMASQQAVFLAAGIVIVLLLLIFSGGTAAVAAVAAWIALMRHFAQTDADRHRRISESYSLGVEQLSSEKMEVRLGGIYTLEHISRESRDDYWTVMETIAAFLRERARRKDQDAVAESEELVSVIPIETSSRFVNDRETQALKSRPPTDIAAALTVIARRLVTERGREKGENRFFNLRGADLRGANLRDLCLEYADLAGTCLEGADLQGAQLKGANLQQAYLKDTNLRVACLEGADLVGACLEGARLQGANLTGAYLRMAHLEGAHLRVADLERALVEGAHFEGAYLVGANLEGVDLSKAVGDAKTWLPDGVPRPAHWPPFQPWPAR
jgi:Pentapeptide repeats (8 copies)